MEIKLLTLLERLKLSYKYSINDKHKKDLLNRILVLENGKQIFLDI